jgi:hypothetical protein
MPAPAAQAAAHSCGKLWFFSWVIIFYFVWKANANMQV